jgi:hypothetical protein
MFQDKAHIVGGDATCVDPADVAAEYEREIRAGDGMFSPGGGTSTSSPSSNSKWRSRFSGRWTKS